MTKHEISESTFNGPMDNGPLGGQPAARPIPRHDALRRYELSHRAFGQALKDLIEAVEGVERDNTEDLCRILVELREFGLIPSTDPSMTVHGYLTVKVSLIWLHQSQHPRREMRIRLVGPNRVPELWKVEFNQQEHPLPVLLAWVQEDRDQTKGTTTVTPNPQPSLEVKQVNSLRLLEQLGEVLDLKIYRTLCQLIVNPLTVPTDAAMNLWDEVLAYGVPLAQQSLWKDLLRRIAPPWVQVEQDPLLRWS